MNKVLIIGSNGMVGSAFYRYYTRELGEGNVLGLTRKEVDLESPRATIELLHYLISFNPSIVILAAAYVGGILRNNGEPYNFLMKNLQIQNNFFKAYIEFKNNVNSECKLLFLGSTCIYPKEAQEKGAIPSDLLSGPLESTNEFYALAKIIGIKIAQQIPNSFSIMPVNLFGLNDTYDMYKSHVIPSLILKCITAPGTSIKVGNPEGVSRELMYVDDVPILCNMLMTKYDSVSLANLGGISYPMEIIIKTVAKMFNPTIKTFIMDPEIPIGVKVKHSKKSLLLDDFNYTTLEQGLFDIKYTCPKVTKLYN
jgi:GDP-L-fucose synthase